MSDGAAPADGAPSAARWLRLTSSALVLTLCGSAALRQAALTGPDAFGRPAWSAGLSVMAGLGLAWICGRATDRRRLAAALTLASLVTCLFGGAALPCEPGLRLALAGLALVAAAPWVRPGPLAATSGALLLASLPALLATRFPGGAVAWLVDVAPLLLQPLLLPAMFGARAAVPTATVVLTTGLVSLVSLTGYLDLAAHLPLPASALLATRLRVLGAHPNLGVPALVTGLLLAAGLLLRRPARDRRPPPAGIPAVDPAASDPAASDPAASDPTASAPMGSDPGAPGAARIPWLAAAALTLLALVAVGSRTGALLAAAGIAGLLLGSRLALPWARLLPAGLALALLLPAVGLADGTIGHQSSSTVSKAVSFRSAMWQLGREHLAAAPWTGHGPGTRFLQGALARAGRYDVLPSEDHPHNLILSVGASLGWTGLAALALLLWVGFGQRTPRDALGRGLTWALAAAWAGNVIDLGGSTDSLYPSLVIVVAALLAAHREAAPMPAGGSTGGTAGGRAWLAGGVVLLGLGLPRAWAEARLSAAERAVHDAAGDPGGTLDRQGWQATLASLSTWMPGDHRPALLASRLVTGDPAEAARHLERVRALAPDLAGPAHDLALVRSRLDLDDPRIEALLASALELQPFGPRAARLHMDRAALAAHRGDAATVARALLAAVLLDPGSLSRWSYLPSTGELLISADGRRTLPYPLAELLAAMESLADARRDDDPAYALRLDMAAPQVARAVGADAIAERLLSDLAGTHPDYARRQAARFDYDAGRYAEALSRLLELGDQGSLQLLAETLFAAAHASPPDLATCERLWDRAPDVLPDVLFEHANVSTLLAARQRWCEHSDDDRGAEQARRALAWWHGEDA